MSSNRSNPTLASPPPAPTPSHPIPVPPAHGHHNASNSPPAKRTEEETAEPSLASSPPAKPPSPRRQSNPTQTAPSLRLLFPHQLTFLYKENTFRCVVFATLTQQLVSTNSARAGKLKIVRPWRERERTPSLPDPVSVSLSLSLRAWRVQVRVRAPRVLVTPYLSTTRIYLHHFRPLPPATCQLPAATVQLQSATFQSDKTRA